MVLSSICSVCANNGQNHLCSGVDSLIAVEIRNWTLAYLQTDLPLMTIRGTGSVQELAELSVKESPLAGADQAF